MSLTVKVAHKGIDEFVEKYATNISVGGLFIRTRDPQPLGTVVHFKIEIANGQRMLQGSAVVRWIRGLNDPAGPAGMGLEFKDLDEASHAVVKRILAGSAGGAPAAPSTAPSIAPLVPSIAPIAPAVAPAKPKAPPPVEKKPAPPPPPPPAPPLNVATAEEHPIEDFDLPAMDADKAVDLDLDALIAGTPAPSPDVPPLSAAAPESFDVDVDIDLDLSAAASEPPPPPPAPPPPAPSLPPLARTAPPPPPPVVPQALKPSTEAAPAPRGQAGAPIFLKPPATIDDRGPVVGIDLGTSNTCCAVLVHGKPQMPRSNDGYSLIPSIVALSRQGALLVGNRAKSQLMLNPSQTVYGAKRLVGRDYESETVQMVRERFHYQIVAGPDGKAAVKLGNHILSLEEVQGIVLHECRQMAERHLGVAVSRAVITCPAYYSEQQREAVRRSAAMAGLKVERILNEPTAAAMAYGLNRGLAKKVLVYDLGGGTFDATVLRIDDNVFEVLATGGDIFLGGIDFDNQIVDELLARFTKQHGVAFSGDPVALSRIAAEAERTKVALSERSEAEALLPMLQMSADGKPLDLKAPITRDELNALCKDLVDRTIDVVKDVLLDAKLKISDLDDIVLVGGMSRMPMVRDRLKALFGKPALASVNADEAVALGAALYSGTVDKVSNVVLIDVVPMTIGIGLPGGGFKRIIERNTPLPASASFALSTSKADETHLELNLFQGEDSQVIGNEYVGTVAIDGLPKGPKGAVQVMVSVKLDPECVLHVEARELRTRALFKATLATRYTPDQIKSRLGITAPAQQTARGKELEKRGGRFWGFLKRTFGKTAA